MVEKYLYTIKHEDGPLKIGISNEPHRRLNDLQASCPKRLDLIWYEVHPHADVAERFAHHHFSESHIRREWFDMTLEQFKSSLPRIRSVTEDNPWGSPERTNDESDIMSEWSNALKTAIKCKKDTLRDRREIQDLEEKLSEFKQHQ